MRLFSLSEIEKMRRQVGVTQTKLAEEAGVSQSLIARIEAGKVDPKYSKVEKIFTALKRLSKGKVLLARDVMSKGVVHVKSRDSVEKAAEIMRKKDISQLPVLDDNNVIVGSITEEDVLDRVAKGTRLEELSLTLVDEIMRESLPEVTKDTPVPLISSLLEYSPAVLVKDRGKTLGIIARSDMLKLVHR